MKKSLITGLLLLLPVILTLVVIQFLFDLFTEPALPLVRELLHWGATRLQFKPPAGTDLFLSRIFALILLVITIFLLGLIARWFFFRNLFTLVRRVISRIPFVKTIYQVSRDIISAIFSTDGKKAFKRPLFFPFPSKSTYALGFEAGEVTEEIQSKTEATLMTVFAPTVPHPISGFLLFVPKEDTKSVAMTNEEAFKYLISCGLILPETYVRKTL
ncbi:MAG: DUF502 domain-containing protein [Verrucomicrobiota bacterium]|nr:DUF502 domain-containing protein [Verrucomicrobiota bacterium]